MQDAPKESSLHPDDLCRIMETCSRLGVIDFEGAGIKLKFGVVRTQFENKEVIRADQDLNAVTTDHEAQAKESLEIDELHEKEDRISMLAIEDPVELERQIASGDLEELVTDATINDE